MTAPTRPHTGAALVEYIGAVVAVGVLMLALVAVREHRPQRRPPVDPVAHVAALVKPMTVPRVRTTPVRRRAVRPPRPRPPRPPGVTVLAPGWAVGW